MKIICHRGPRGRVSHGCESSDGSARCIDGDVFGLHTITEERAEVVRLLAPEAPGQILSIGLNYRRHAAIPKQPVLFVKGIDALAHPGEPIVIPQVLRRDEVDSVLGYACANDVLQPGDSVSVEIERIGALTNTVALEA